MGTIFLKPVIEESWMVNQSLNMLLIYLTLKRIPISLSVMIKRLRETKMRDILTQICPQGTIFEVPVAGRLEPVHPVSLIFVHIPNDEEVIVS